MTKQFSDKPLSQFSKTERARLLWMWKLGMPLEFRHPWAVAWVPITNLTVPANVDLHFRIAPNALEKAAQAQDR